MLLFVQEASSVTDTINITSVKYVDRTGSLKILSTHGSEHFVRMFLFLWETPLLETYISASFNCLLSHTLKRLKAKKNYNCAPRRQGPTPFLSFGRRALKSGFSNR
jgi:hypothetical protein